MQRNRGCFSIEYEPLPKGRVNVCVGHSHDPTNHFLTLECETLTQAFGITKIAIPLLIANEKALRALADGRRAPALWELIRAAATAEKEEATP